MKRQPQHEEKKTDPEIIIKATRLEILTMLQKRSLKIKPADFILETYESTEYPKMVQIKNGERIDTIRIHSREQEDALENLMVNGKMREGPRIFGRKTVIGDGYSKDSSAGD